MNYLYFKTYEDLDSYLSDPEYSWTCDDVEIFLDYECFDEIVSDGTTTGAFLVPPTDNWFFYCPNDYSKLLKIRRASKAHRGLLPKLI